MKMKCRCKRSKCLLMYCVCFRDSSLCTSECSCFTCHNKRDSPTLRESLKRPRKLKDCCDCPRNRCNTRYCKCRRKKRFCGSDCGCTGCLNTKDWVPILSTPPPMDALQLLHELSKQIEVN